MQFDSEATGFIPVLSFRNFIEKLEPPMGFKNVKELSRLQKNIRIAHLHIPIYHIKDPETKTI